MDLAVLVGGQGVKWTLSKTAMGHLVARALWELFSTHLLLMKGKKFKSLSISFYSEAQG